MIKTSHKYRCQFVIYCGRGKLLNFPVLQINIQLLYVHLKISYISQQWLGIMQCLLCFLILYTQRLFLISALCLSKSLIDCNYLCIQYLNLKLHLVESIKDYFCLSFFFFLFFIVSIPYWKVCHTSQLLYKTTAGIQSKMPVSYTAVLHTLEMDRLDKIK